MRRLLLLLALSGSAVAQIFGGGGSGSGTVGSCAAPGNAYYAGSGTVVGCDTSVTDNGSGTFSASNLTATTLQTFPAGTPTAPGFVSSLSATYGLTASSATNWCMGTGAANSWSMCWSSSGKLELVNGGIFCFSSSASNASATACDTGVSRDQAGVVDVGTGAQGSKVATVQTRRFSVDGGTTLVAGDFALSAGWGTTASIAITNATSKDAAALVTVTSSGTGQAANPTLTLTFHDGAWIGNPVCQMIQNGGNDIFGDITGSTVSAGSVIGTWAGTPTAAKTYQFQILCTGT